VSGEGVLRHQSRERALSLLYEAELKEISASEVVSQLAIAPDEFCLHLLSLVNEYGVKADALVGEASLGWPLERMAVIDRLILRMAVCELFDKSGPPVAVILDEAVELAKTYSTESSGSFVNGVLSTIAPKLR